MEFRGTACNRCGVCHPMTRLQYFEQFCGLGCWRLRIGRCLAPQMRKNGSGALAEFQTLPTKVIKFERWCAAAAPFWGMNFLRLMWVSIAYAIMQFGITAIVYFNPLIVGEPQPSHDFVSPAKADRPMSTSYLFSCISRIEGCTRLTLHGCMGWSALQVALSVAPEGQQYRLCRGGLLWQQLCQQGGPFAPVAARPGLEDGQDRPHLHRSLGACWHWHDSGKPIPVQCEGATVVLARDRHAQHVCIHVQHVVC